jgi:hypothetical protein
MAGVGSAGLNAYEWLQHYDFVVREMRFASAALGTDFNGLVKGMPHRPNANAIHYSAGFPKSRLGHKEWDYNTEGVAHYGMLAEFLMDARTAPNGTQLIDQNLMYGADNFFRAWQKCEALRTKVK